MDIDLDMLSSAELKSISSAKVLIVDDNKHNQDLFSKFLAVMEISDIDCADDGIKAIEMITKADYDLVILDVIMPNMNGEEFLLKIRAVPELQDIPVIVQTGDSSVTAKEKMFKAGATDFVAKPVSPLEFFSRVRVHLENRMLVKKLNTQIQKMTDSKALICKMQQSLYPDKIKTDSIANIYGLDFQAKFKICEKIGGDFWDTIKIDDDNLFIIVGEASGYGIATSMNVFRIKAMLDDMGVPSNADIGKHFSEFNDKLQPLLLRGQFVAMACFWINFKENKIYYTNAGYQSPIIKNKNGEISTFTAKANPLGMVKGTAYRTESVDFNSGDVVYIYGSFIINGKNIDGVNLGIEGVKNLISDCSGADELMEKFANFVADSNESDNVALSIARK